MLIGVPMKINACITISDPKRLLPHMQRAAFVLACTKLILITFVESALIRRTQFCLGLCRIPEEEVNQLFYGRLGHLFMVTAASVRAA